MTNTPLPTLIVRRARETDRAAVERLLTAAKLPVAGVAEHFEHFVVALGAGGLCGAIGLEVYGEAALMRSAVVDEAVRERGIGTLLLARGVEHAQQCGVKRLYLLTETAEEYFERFGFRRVEREQARAEVGRSTQFTDHCCDAAACMRKDLA